MSYGKVKESFWTDKKMLALSDDARMLALYLLTGPHRNLIGCMRVPDGYLLADLRWSSERLADAIAMLSRCHFICRDDEGWTIILNQLRHDPFKVPNHAKSAIALANQVPQESIVFQHLVPRLKAALDGIGMASAWHTDTIAIPEPSPLPAPAPEPAPAIEPPSAGAGAPSIRTIDLSEPDHFALPAFADRRDEGEAVRMWNDLASRLSLPRVQKLTRARESALRKRLADCGGIKGWVAALEKIEANAWMHGGNKRGWKADFDFLVQEKSFTRLMEGSYDHTPDQKPGNGFAAILAEAEQISRGGNFGPGESELQPGG